MRGPYELEDRLEAEPLSPDDDAARRLALLADVGEGRSPQLVRLLRPSRTAAFSRRDALLPGFGAAQDAARSHGFAPVVRPVGGRMAPYHPGTLIVDVIGRSDDPRRGMTARFELVADATVEVLEGLGLDARTGELPREYCPGQHSVHVVTPGLPPGATKVAGTAQRQTRHAYLVSTLLVVHDGAPLRAVTTDVYAALGLDLDPATVGAVADHVPGGRVGVEEVAAALVQALAGRLDP
ncbi:lipoate--protein ligase family protein [Quadrisphaera oryzae]|uniref:lipoate--protein ligase family protein n=1 Tax=Quadrisphaera TaxID=317661 RepID=UPI00164485B3|nr:lipoate--protein ligase family protein [Quadrisphaera sp. RL12-1S]MBC3762220.1 lipoate--protein ligase family protein [Quadrisphaera sp. RL12-1S]